MKKRAPVKTRNGSTGILLLLILGLGLSLRLLALSEKPIWSDEILFIDRSAAAFSDVFSRGVSSPLPILILKLAGGPEAGKLAVFRLPSVLAGMISVFGLYWFGASLWNRNIGLWSSFLLAASPIALNFSQTSGIQGYEVAFTILSTGFLLNALRSGRISHWIGYVLSTAFLINASLAAFPVLLLQAVLLIGIVLVGFFRPGKMLFSLVNLCKGMIFGGIAVLSGWLQFGFVPSLFKLYWSWIIRARPSEFSLDPVSPLIGDFFLPGNAALLMFLLLFVFGWILSLKKYRDLAFLGLVWIGIPGYLFFNSAVQHGFKSMDGLIFFPFCLLFLGAGMETVSSVFGEFAGKLFAAPRQRLVQGARSLLGLGVLLMHVSPIRMYYEGTGRPYHETEKVIQSAAALIAENIAEGQAVVIPPDDFSVFSFCFGMSGKKGVLLTDPDDLSRPDRVQPLEPFWLVNMELPEWARILEFQDMDGMSLVKACRTLKVRGTRLDTSSKNIEPGKEVSISASILNPDRNFAHAASRFAFLRKEGDKKILAHYGPETLFLQPGERSRMEFQFRSPKDPGKYRVHMAGIDERLRLFPFESKGLQHPTGRKVAAPLGISNFSVKAEAGKDKPGFLLIGPDAELDAGKYSSWFFLRCGSPEEDTIVAVCDAYNEDRRTVLSEKKVKGTDLGDPARFRMIRVDFKLRKPRKVTMRVHYSGSADLECAGVIIRKVSAGKR